MKNKLITAFLIYATIPLIAHETTTPKSDISLVEALQMVQISILQASAMSPIIMEEYEEQLNPESCNFTSDILHELYNSDIYREIFLNKVNTCLNALEEFVYDTTKSFDDIDFYTYYHPSFPGSFTSSIIPLDEEVRAKTYSLHKSIYIKYQEIYRKKLGANWEFNDVSFDDYLEKEDIDIHFFEMVTCGYYFNEKLLEEIDVKIVEELKSRNTRS